MNTYYSPTNINTSDEMYRRALYFQAQAKQERREIRRLSNMLGLAILAFEFVQVIFSFFLAFNPEINELYESSMLFQEGISIILVEFFGLVVPFGLIALINKNKYKVNLIPNDKVGFAKGFRWVAFGMLGCMAANFIVDGIIAAFNAVGYDLDYPEMLKPDSAFACVMAIVATAVVPALCEEFAMRCCSLGLMRNYGKAFGVFSVSIIFGLLHGNVIQFAFAGLVGVVLGYVTVKTGSVLPAMLIHGLNNGISAICDVMDFVLEKNPNAFSAISGAVEKAGEEASGIEPTDIFTYAVFGFWIVLGIICAAWIFFKGEFKNETKKAEKQPFANSLGTKLGTFASAPLMLLSYPFLLWATFASIVPIDTPVK